jgi:hypothetical protein
MIFFSCKFFSIFGHQTLDPELKKMLDPKPCTGKSSVHVKIQVLSQIKFFLRTNNIGKEHDERSAKNSINYDLAGCPSIFQINVPL